MFFRRLFGVFFIFLLLGGVFSLFNGNGRSQDAYMQGYIAGQQSVTTEDGATTIVAPAPQPYANRHSGFGFLGGIVKFFTFFFGFMFLIGFMGMLFGCKRGKHHGWHHARHWGNWQKGDKNPPWYDHNDNDEPVMKA